MAHPSADSRRSPSPSCAAARVPGAESAGEPHLRAEVDLARRARPRRGDDRGHRGRRHPAISAKLHRRGHRQEGLRPIYGYLTDAKRTARVMGGGGDRREGPATSSSPALVQTADLGYRCCARRSSAGGHRVRLRRREVGSRPCGWSTATSPYALTGAVFAPTTPPSREAAARPPGAARDFYVNGDHGGGRGPAALRRRRAVGHRRQGRLEARPRPLGERKFEQVTKLEEIGQRKGSI